MWAIHNRKLKALAEGGAAKALHAVLHASIGADDRKLTYPLRTLKPFVLARGFGTMSWDRHGGQYEIYRFQRGPRAWSKQIYIYDGHKVSDRLPNYERDAEQLAKTLKLVGWEKLAAKLLPSGPASASDEDELRHLQVVLCWQENGRYLVVHDRGQGQAIAFQWDADRLVLVGEAHPERLLKLEGCHFQETFESPVVPLEEGKKELKASEKAGQLDEFVKAIEWRYATKQDYRLDSLLLEACDRMREIDGDLGIAYAGHRFNDATGDDCWLAVRSGNFAWENGVYFQRDAQSLRSAPPEIHSLLGLLVHLQSSGLSSAFTECYGYPVDALDVIGLFRQDGRHFFACSNSQNTCGPVYEIDAKNGHSKLCGFSDRYDWNFNVRPRAGGIVPKDDVLELVTMDELVRRVETGETPYDAGPPHGLAVPWMLYLPRDPFD